MAPTAMKILADRNGITSQTPGVDHAIKLDLFFEFLVSELVIKIARDVDSGRFVNEKKIAQSTKYHRLQELVTELECRSVFQREHHDANFEDLMKRYTGVKCDIKKNNQTAGHGADATSAWCDALLQRCAASNSRARGSPQLPPSSAIASSPAPAGVLRSSPQRKLKSLGSAAVSRGTSKRKASLEVPPPNNAKRANTRGTPVSKVFPSGQLGEDRQFTTPPAPLAVAPTLVKKATSTPQNSHAVEESSLPCVNPPPTNFPQFIQVVPDQQGVDSQEHGKLIVTDRLLMDGSIHSGSFDYLVHRINRSPQDTFFLSVDGAMSAVSDSSTLEAWLQSIGASGNAALVAQPRPAFIDDLDARMRESTIGDDEALSSCPASEEPQSSSRINREERDAGDVHESPVPPHRRLRKRFIIQEEEDEDVDMGGVVEERTSAPVDVEDALTDQDVDEDDAASSVAPSQGSTIQPDDKTVSDPPSPPLREVEPTIPCDPPDQIMAGSSADLPIESSQISTKQPDEKPTGDPPSDPPDQIMAGSSADLPIESSQISTKQLDEKPTGDPPSDPPDQIMAGSSADLPIESSQISTKQLDEKPTGDPPSDPPDQIMAGSSVDLPIESSQISTKQPDEKPTGDPPSDPPDQIMAGSSADLPNESSQISTKQPDEKPTGDPPSDPTSHVEPIVPSDPPDQIMAGSSADLPIESSQISTKQPDEKPTGDPPSDPPSHVEPIVPSDLPDQIMANGPTEFVDPPPQPINIASAKANIEEPALHPPTVVDAQTTPHELYRDPVVVAPQPAMSALSGATARARSPVDPVPSQKMPGQTTPSSSTADSPTIIPAVPSHLQGSREFLLDDLTRGLAQIEELSETVEVGEGPTDDADDERDFDEKKEAYESAAARARMASTVIERGQLDFELVPRFCEMMRLGQPKDWDPNAQHPHELVGAKVVPKSYQLLTAVIAMHEEHRLGQICSTGDVRRTVGYGINHEAGLGKTLIAVYKFWFHNWLLCAWMRIHASRRANDGKHLAESAHGQARCPSDGKDETGDLPFRCPCEPSGLSRELWAEAGATIVVTTLSLLSNFEQEVLSLVDLESLSSVWGWPVTLALGHNETSKFGTDRVTANLLRQYMSETPTLRDWATANQMSENELRLHVEINNKFSPSLRLPRQRGGTPANGLIIITTPQSIKGIYCGGVLHQSLCSQSTRNRSVSCADGLTCMKDGSKKNTGHPKSHNLTVPRVSGLRIPIAEIVVDEAHQTDQKGAGAIASLKQLFSETVSAFGVGLTVCPMTGTPRSKSPLELLSYPLVHVCGEWSRDNDLDQLRRLSKQAIEVFRAVRAVKVDETLTEEHYHVLCDAASRRKGAVGHEARKCSVQNGSAERLADRAWKAVGEPVGLALLRRAIEFRAADTYNNRPFVQLPPLVQKVCMLRHQDWQLNILAPLGPQYEALMSKRRMALKAAVHKPSKNRVGDAPTANAIKSFLRYLEMCINVPYLHTICEGDITELKAGTVLDNGWFQKPKSSRWWKEGPELYQSSPKLQYLVDRVKTLPFVDADPAGDPRLRGEKVRDKLIIFAHEPVMALLAYIVIQQQCPDITVEAIYRATNATDKTERAEILARFAHRPSPRAAMGKDVTYGPQLDVLVVCTKIGGTGITLTKSNEAVLFDVDPDSSRFIQVPKRAHRISQTRPVTCIQLVMEAFELEGWRLKRVTRGAEVANCLPHLGTLATGGPATPAVVHSPGDSKHHAILLDDP